MNYSSRNIAAMLKKHPLEIILLGLFFFLSLFAPGFFTTSNLLNVLRNISTQGIIAFGMTMVIVSGEIDLSIGSVVALTGCLTAWLVSRLSPLVGLNIAVFISIPASLFLGVIIGLFTGVARKRFNIPSFIITLSLLTILFGAANLVTGGFSIASFPEWYSYLGSGRIGGVLPFPALIFILYFFALQFVMNYTTLGRSLYAVGGNIKSAHISGIDVFGVKTWAFVITSFTAALSGILVSSQIMSGNPGTARGWELDVIASVIIGGTSLFGGKGTIRGTAIGVLFLGLVINGMTLMNIDEYWQYVVRGTLVLLAVLIHQLHTHGSSR